jgi:hypothetical protein
MIFDCFFSFFIKLKDFYGIFLLQGWILGDFGPGRMVLIKMFSRGNLSDMTGVVIALSLA